MTISAGFLLLLSNKFGFAPFFNNKEEISSQPYIAAYINAVFSDYSFGSEPSFNKFLHNSISLFAIAVINGVL
jgi:hypothetical protein